MTAVATDQTGGRALFVHDFVPVDLPYGTVVGAFATHVSPDLVANLAIEAWRVQAGAVGETLGVIDLETTASTSVAVTLGPHRTRRAALVVPISWQRTSVPWMPPLEADIEVVAYGTDRTHLHLLGRSELSPWTWPSTDQASLEHRLAVAMIRHLLVRLAESIAESIA